VSFREELRARAARTPARIVFPEGSDPRIRAAAAILRQQGIAIPLLLGVDIDPARDARLPAIGDRMRERRPEAVHDGVHALDLATDPLRFAAGMVALDEADGCVAGAVAPTSDVIRAALWLLGLAPGQRTVSAAMYLGLPDRVLTFTDIAVVPSPTPEQLAHSALAAARDRTALVGDAPIVAFLSFSTKGSALGPQVDRMREAAELFRLLAPEIIADGELQVDAALVPDVAARKSPSSPVAGQANVLVFPDLDAANIGYKLTQRLAHATAAGPLLQGLACPMSDLSRGAEPDDIVDVAAMVALQAGARRPAPEPQE
jgi:phosphate acetyltransferase